MSMVRTFCLPLTEFDTAKFERADISKLTSRGQNYQLSERVKDFKSP